VLLAYSHDQQKELNAKQRDFAKTGAHPFTHNGKKYVTWQTSINSTPANVEVVTANDDVVLNTDLLNKGSCTQPNLSRAMAPAASTIRPPCSCCRNSSAIACSLPAN
jgi:hypothetical protein